MRVITYGDLFDAIEKNGLPQAFGEWFETAESNSRGNDTWQPLKDEITAACAVGQAALNLNVNLHSLRDADQNNKWELGLYSDYNSVISVIESLNDEDRLPLVDIAAKCRKKYFNLIDVPLMEVPE